MTISQGTSDRKHNPRIPEKMLILAPQKKSMGESFTTWTETDGAFFSPQPVGAHVSVKGLLLSNALCLLFVTASAERTDRPQTHIADPQTPYTRYQRFTIC